MNIKPIIKKYFLPLVFYFFSISILSNIPVIQQTYYPFFEKISLHTLSNSQPSIYFKAKQGTEEAPNNLGKMSIYFNTKTHLMKLVNHAKRTGKRVTYNDLKVYKLLHYACSSVTSITVVLLVWILTLRKSNLNRLVFVKT